MHKDTVVAGVRLIEDDGSIRREVETFSTATPGLLALSDWLEGHGLPLCRDGSHRHLLAPGLAGARRGGLRT